MSRARGWRYIPPDAVRITQVQTLPLLRFYLVSNVRVRRYWRLRLPDAPARRLASDIPQLFSLAYRLPEPVRGGTRASCLVIALQFRCGQPRGQERRTPDRSSRKRQ